MQENEKYYLEIKDRIIDTETTIRAKDYSKNRVVLENYYEIGRLIVEAQGGEERAKYGDRLIKEYSLKLTCELGKGYTVTALKRIRKFFLIIEKGATLSHQLSWSTYVELLKLDDLNEFNYYLNTIKQNSLTVRQVREKIKNNEYGKLSIETRKKLINNQKPELTELVKDPIVINNSNNIEIVSERQLQKLIMEDITGFLRKLGNNYMFVGQEYPAKIGDRYYKIDLLLYNKEYRSYIVVELKIGELKHLHIGQIELYINYIDKNLKDNADNSTIGIILCHKNNKLIMEYVSDSRIMACEYILN